MRRFPGLLFLALVAAGCSGPAESTTTASPVSTTTATSSSPTTAADLSRPPRCDTRAEAVEVGRVTDDELSELSGAVVSRNRPGVVWVHNDSGSEAVIYAIDPSGSVIDTVALPDLTARDWEDIAIGPGPNPDTDYLYIADIGDNRGDREEVQVHRIPEPAAGSTEARGGDTLRLVYPTGPREAETLLVDGTSGDLLILEKAISGVTRLFEVPGTVDWGQAQQAIPRGDIQLGAFATATGGDADQDRVVIRTYDEVFLWERQPDQSLIDTLLTPGCRIATLREPQGEAIALTPEGFYTLSEGVDQPVLAWGPSS